MVTQSRPANGYSAWRLIAEELRREILDGAVAPGARLATERELAGRFSVNRHTARRAVAELADQGLVEARRGSGTYVVEHKVAVHRIGVRTRLNDSLARRGARSPGRVLGSALEPDPPSVVSERLALRGGAALRLEAVRTLHGVPIARSTQWLSAERGEGLEAHYRQTRSMTLALRAVGITDYVRAATSVSARLVTAAESEDLQLAAGAVVLVVRALDCLPDGTPLKFAVTRFPADRVELDIEHPSASDG